MVIAVNVGDTVQFASVSQSSARSTKPHFFTVEGLGIDISLESNTQELYEITFTRAGEFPIDESSDPGAHSDAKFVVT